MKVALTRRAHFNAAHRLHNPKWDEEKNKDVFGHCSNPHFHGHNYELEVRVIGMIDKDTGFVYDTAKLKKIIKEEVEDRFDHKNLNIETPYFKDLIPTTENLSMIIYNLIRERIDPEFEIRIRLYETPRIFVDYPA
jgi:6-pyruvoyltetrahydropterin/6-carboxytetrahydropterin synthase